MCVCVCVHACVSVCLYVLACTRVLSSVRGCICAFVCVSKCVSVLVCAYVRRDNDMFSLSACYCIALLVAVGYNTYVLIY